MNESDRFFKESQFVGGGGLENSPEPGLGKRARGCPTAVEMA